MIFYQKKRKLYKYKLTSPYSIKINWLQGKNVAISGKWIIVKDSFLCIRQAYAWDGPSGPSIDTKTFMRSSLVHDALYQLIRENIIPFSYRKQADQEMRKINIEDGMNKFRAWYTYWAVRLFGKYYAKPYKRYQTLTAP